MDAAVSGARWDGRAGFTARERSQDVLTNDLKMGDDILDWDAWLRVGSPHRRTFIEARAEQQRRTNFVEDVTEKTRLTTFLVLFGTEQ